MLLFRVLPFFFSLILASKNDELWARQQSGIIKFTSADFAKYIKDKPRDYDMFAMTTALSPSRGCAVCAEAAAEYKIFVNSALKYHGEKMSQKKVFFAMLDYDDAPDSFHFLKLNSAPGFFHFGSSFKLQVQKSDKLDLNRVGFGADKFAQFVASKTDLNVEVVRPVDYTKFIMLGIGLSILIILGYFIGFKWSWLCSNTLWAIIAISVILAMTSGQMWNHIRNPPPMGRSGRGMSFIANSSQQQYVFETYAIGVLYFLTSLSVVILGDFSSNPKTDNGKRRIMSFFGLLLFVVIYSVILNIFGQKYQGYPYKLLF